MAELFGFHHHPFADIRKNAKPFISAQDDRLCDRALSLLSCGKSLAICGPCGVGKSTLVAHLIGRLDPNCYKPVLLHYAGFNRAGLLRAVADRLGVDTNGRSLPLLVTVQKHFMQLASANNSLYPVIVVDDAQLLERESMLDLCALMVSAEKKTAAASIVLVGDNSLRRRLELNAMAAVASRLTAVFTLDALDEKDSAAFISHRLSQAKAHEHLFDAAAVDMIAAHCRGNRRKIINCATLLLEEAYFRQENTVTAQTMLECELITPADIS
jgi:type II secretory pathway predicted ATPase ExeA